MLCLISFSGNLRLFRLSNLSVLNFVFTCSCSRDRCGLTRHVQASLGGGLASRVDGHHRIRAGVVRRRPVDDQRAAVALEQQLGVLGLLHRPVAVVPNHLRRRGSAEGQKVRLGSEEGQRKIR